jgi:hypothetical protein
MKKPFALLLLLLIGFIVSAQSVAPKQVTDAFTKKFAEAQKIEWSQEDASTWEAEFMLDNVEKSACFSEKGEWLETETEICKKELPAEVFKTLALVFDGFEIEEINKIEKVDNNRYELLLDKGETEVEIMASPDGSFSLEAIEVGMEESGSHCCKNIQTSCKSAGMEKDDDDKGKDKNEEED